jgi:hypothetical protein
VRKLKKLSAITKTIAQIGAAQTKNTRYTTAVIKVDLICVSLVSAAQTPRSRNGTDLSQ